MASIHKRNGGYTVRWRTLAGQPVRRQAPSQEAAKRLKREVEESLACGRDWEPEAVRGEPTLDEVMRAFLEESVRVHRPSTACRHASCLEVFRRWLHETVHPSPAPVTALSKKLLSDFYGYLCRTGLHDRKRKASSVAKILSVVQLAWSWANEEDEFHDIMPAPRKLKVPTQPGTPTVAPTWEQMDACIEACNGWQRQLAIVLRFTGLRVQQVMQLRWDDFDLAAATLTVRGELGKTRQEQTGRIVPVSRHFVEELRTWDRHDSFVVECGRREDGPRAREARARDIDRAWKRAGVRPDVWKGRGHHAFRKGFVSGLRRAGADPDTVEVLVGHSLGLRGVYTDPDALPMREAVDLIPPLRQFGTVVPFPDSERVAE